MVLIGLLIKFQTSITIQGKLLEMSVKREWPKTSDSAHKILPERKVHPVGARSGKRTLKKLLQLLVLAQLVWASLTRNWMVKRS